MITMAAITANVGLDLGVPESVREADLAYIVAVLESTHEDRLEADVDLGRGSRSGTLGALEVYVLPPAAGRKLVAARERGFVAKAAGADDIVDVVVPRATIPWFMTEVAVVRPRSWARSSPPADTLAMATCTCPSFNPMTDRRSTLMRGILQSAGWPAGGAVSGEHGIGTEKRR